MEVKVTYVFKVLFLIFSWIILFQSNSTDNPQIFLTSIMIYSGAIIFDLIFNAIESCSKASSSLKGAYYISIVLIIFNGLCTVIAFLGAIGCLSIEKLRNMYYIVIVEGTFTEIFSESKYFLLELKMYLIFALLFSIMEVFPGLLILKDEKQKQIESSD